MTRFRIVARLASIFAGLAALVSLALPATTAAATPSPMAIYVPRLDGPCMFFTAPANQTIALVWKNSIGVIKESTSIPTGTGGDPMYCSSSNVVQVGDLLKASNGPKTHKLTIPNLTAEIDRETDTMSGRGPVGTLRIECGGSPYGQFEPCQYVKIVTVNSSHRWSLHLPFDLFGGFTMSAKWHNSYGDIVYRWATTPYFRVFLGQARVSGFGVPDTQPSVLLEDSSHMQKGMVMTTAATDGSFSGTLRDGSNHKVNVQPGDYAISDIAGDADFQVPTITATATASNDRVVGQCELNGTYNGVFVELFRNGHRVGAAYEGLNDGSFDFDFRHTFPDPANVKVGDKLFIGCIQGEGDRAIKVIFAQ